MAFIKILDTLRVAPNDLMVSFDVVYEGTL